MATVDEQGSLNSCFSDPCSAADHLFGKIKGVGGRINVRNPDKPALQNSSDALNIPRRRALAAEGKDALLNSPLIVGLYNEYGNAVVGKGRRAKPEPRQKKLGIDDEQYTELVDSIKLEWRADMYSKRKWIDQEGNMTLPEMQKMVLSQTCAVGEMYTLAYYFLDEIRPFRTALGLIDDDRVRTPRQVSPKFTEENKKNTIAGHLYGPSRRTNTFYVHEWHRNDPRNDESIEPFTPVRRYNEFGREQIIHTYINKMPGMTRGLSDLTSAFGKLKCFEKYQKTQLEKAIMQMGMAFVVKSNDKNILGQIMNGGMEPPEELLKKMHALGMKKVAESQELIDGSNFGFDGTKAIRLLENEEAELLTANTSTNDDKQFQDGCITEVARATGASRAVVTQDFEASYSAARGVMISFYRQVDNLGHYIVDDWTSSVYAIWLEDKIQTGQIAIPNYPDPMDAWMHFVLNRESYCGVSFSGPAREEIDAAKTAQAAKIEQEIGGFCYQEYFDRYKGKDYEDAFKQQFTELKKWNDLLVANGYERLNKKEALAWLRPKFTLLANAEEQSETQEIINRNE